MKTIDDIISDIIRAEGTAYTNDPRDSGGPTKYGITQAALASWRGTLVHDYDVKNLTESEARDIYKQRYYVGPGYAKVAALLPGVAVELMDSGVNVGPDRATKWLQTALNAFNGSYKTPPSWPELVVDGRIGPGTISALTAMITLRGVSDTSAVLLRALNAQQGAHYLSISAASPKNEAFTFGWFLNRVS